MLSNSKDTMVTEKKYEIIDKIIEHGIYLYIFLMFLSKGEGIRNILIFGSFALWVLTLKQRKNLYLLKKPVSVLCWIYLLTIPHSVIFSIDPLYSLSELKGDPLKFAMLFPLISTVMADKDRLKVIAIASLLSALVLALVGYYSFIFHDIPVLTPDTPLARYHWNRFAGYLNTLIPVAFILYFTWENTVSRPLLVVSLIIIVTALIMSSSRTGIFAFLCIILVWALHLHRKRKINFIKAMAIMIISVIVVGSVLYHFLPGFRQRISDTWNNISTLSERTILWDAAITASRQRPLAGWGFGDKTFHMDEPFVDTPYKKGPEKGAHNKFLSVLFAQGITGMLAYSLLIITALVFFWREAHKSSGIKSYILTACSSIFFGYYLIHSLMESMAGLPHIAVILGIGMAATAIDENSNN